MYEKKIKGQALFQIFADMLVEVYQQLDADKAGWRPRQIISRTPP